jgi:hypothetical protein
MFRASLVHPQEALHEGLVPSDDGQVMPEICQGFNKVKVIVKCIKSVRVVKLQHDARSTEH